MRNTKALDEWEEKQNTTILAETEKVYNTEVLEGYYNTDPINLKDTLSRPNKHKWIEVMQDEFNLLKENNIWELVPRSVDRDVIDSRWVFYLKHNIDDT